MAKRSFDSALISEAEYSYTTEQLTLTLADAKRYRFYQVPSTVWRSMLKAESVGSYASRNVMRGRYRKRKLA